MIKVAHVLVSGFVQGIGFRSFIKNQTVSLGLTGWVKNLPNGQVEAVFEGEEEKIKEMISLCRQGPPIAEVEKIDVGWQSATGDFSSFEIN